MADTDNNSRQLRRGTRIRTPAKGSEQYWAARAKAGGNQGAYADTQAAKRRYTEDESLSSPPKFKPRLAPVVEVPIPSPRLSRNTSHNAPNNKKQPKDKGKGKATLVPSSRGLSPVKETTPPKYPGPRPPPSGDPIKDGVDTEEWTRQRLIWFLSVRDGRPIASTTDYDDLKRILGPDPAWDSDDERCDNRVFQQRKVKTTASIFKGIETGQFDSEPPRRKVVQVQAVPPPKAAAANTKTQNVPKQKSQAGTGLGQQQATHQNKPVGANQPSKTQAAQVSKRNKYSNSSGLVIQKLGTNTQRIPSTNRPTQQAGPDPSTSRQPQASKTLRPPVPVDCDRERSSDSTPPYPSAKTTHPSNTTRPQDVETNSRNVSAAPTRSQPANKPNSAPSGVVPRAPGDGTRRGPPTGPVERTRNVSSSSAAPRNEAPRSAVSTGSSSTRIRLIVTGGIENGVNGDRREVNEGAPPPDEEGEDSVNRGNDGEDTPPARKPQSGRRARVQDYSGTEKAVLRWAGDAYKAIMATEGMYETDVKILDKRRRKAWQMACDRYEVDKADVPLTEAHVQSLTDRLVSWRGHARRSIKEHVTYSFFSQKINKALKTRDDWDGYIEELKEGGLHKLPNSSRGKGHFQHPILQICMDETIFRHPKDIGVLFSDLFRAPSAALICFFCALIQSLIDGREKTKNKLDPLDFEEQRKSFNTHMGSHARWLRRAPDRWEMIQKQLYLRGFKNSGASHTPTANGVEKYMLREEDLASDGPDLDELAEWEAEMAELDPAHTEPEQVEEPEYGPPDVSDGEGDRGDEFQDQDETERWNQDAGEHGDVEGQEREGGFDGEVYEGGFEGEGHEGDSEGEGYDPEGEGHDPEIEGHEGDVEGDGYESRYQHSRGADYQPDEDVFMADAPGRGASGSGGNGDRDNVPDGVYDGMGYRLRPPRGYPDEGHKQPGRTYYQDTDVGQEPLSSDYGDDFPMDPPRPPTPEEEDEEGNS